MCFRSRSRCCATGLPDAGTAGLRLETSRDDGGTWLRLTFPADAARVGGDQGELMLVDSMADRWGHRGGTDLPTTLWALLR